MTQWLSHVLFFTTPWTVTHQAPLSMGFSRPECWSGLPFSTPRDLPNPETELTSLASPAMANGILYHWATDYYTQFTDAIMEVQQDQGT